MTALRHCMMQQAMDKANGIAGKISWTVSKGEMLCKLTMQSGKPSARTTARKLCRCTDTVVWGLLYILRLSKGLTKLKAKNPSNFFRFSARALAVLWTTVNGIPVFFCPSLNRMLFRYTEYSGLQWEKSMDLAPTDPTRHKT
eukprot:PhF_6_TR31475/c4_g1_i3/m.46248